MIGRTKISLLNPITIKANEKQKPERDGRAEMSETDASDSKSFPKSLFYPLQTTTSQSLEIISKTPIIFISITTLTILPFTLLLFSLAFSSRPLEDQISYKTNVAEASQIPVEVQHVYEEARSDALSVLRLKAIYFLPSYVLSLIAAITAVSSSSVSYHGKRPSRITALTAVLKTWKSFAATSAFVFVLACGCSYFTRGLRRLERLAHVYWVVGGVGMVLDAYVKEVLSLGMVVSILEERLGMEALMVGWELMEGRRFCGVLLGGLLVLESGGIGWGLRILMDGKMEGGHWKGIAGMVSLVGLFCWVVLWSFVSNTVFYFECKKFHASGMDSRSIELVNDTL